MPTPRTDNTATTSQTVAQRILLFNENLAAQDLLLPPGFSIRNPFSGALREHVRAVTESFYTEFYNDNRPRKLVLGSSPARRGTAVTGVPFADADVLTAQSGVEIEGFAVNRRSSGFLDDVIHLYGGRESFYGEFLMNFVCPLGIVKTKQNGAEVNANYYETKKLRESTQPFILGTLRQQLELGVDNSVCYCIGSGENFKFLSALNSRWQLFGSIVPLAHPRFITQYKPDQRNEFVEQYLNAFRDPRCVL